MVPSAPKVYPVRVKDKWQSIGLIALGHSFVVEETFRDDGKRVVFFCFEEEAGTNLSNIKKNADVLVPLNAIAGAIETWKRFVYSEQ